VGEGTEVLGIVPIVIVGRAERGGEAAGDLEVELRCDLDGLRSSLITLGVVHRHGGYQMSPIVPFDPEPRRDVGVLPDRGPAPGTTITIGGAELTQRAAHAQPPPVVELGMDI